MEPFGFWICRAMLHSVYKIISSTTPFLFGEGKIDILTIIFSHSQHSYASESNYHTLNKTYESFSLPSTLRLPERQWFYTSNLYYPAEGNGYPIQSSCLENSRDREAWRAIVHGVATYTIGSFLGCCH